MIGDIPGRNWLPEIESFQCLRIVFILSRHGTITQSSARKCSFRWWITLNIQKCFSILIEWWLIPVHRAGKKLIPVYFRSWNTILKAKTPRSAHAVRSVATCSRGESSQIMQIVCGLSRIQYHWVQKFLIFSQPRTSSDKCVLLIRVREPWFVIVSGVVAQHVLNQGCLQVFDVSALVLLGFFLRDVVAEFIYEFVEKYRHKRMLFWSDCLFGARDEAPKMIVPTA